MKRSSLIVLATSHKFFLPTIRTTVAFHSPLSNPQFHINNKRIKNTSIRSYSTIETTMKSYKKANQEENVSPSSKVIGTHSGTFQADEALGVWLLRQIPLYYKSKVIRSRDPDVLKTCDIVIDVGGEYNHSIKKYDHHQTPYDEKFNEEACTNLSASGLIYKHYGKEVITTIYPMLLDETNNCEWVYNKMYKNFMMAIDAIDTGVEIAPECKYKDSTNLSSRVARLNPRWNEESNKDIMDAKFEIASATCGNDFISMLETIVESELPARGLVEQALAKRMDVHASNQIITFPNGGLPWKQHLYELEKINNLTQDKDLIKFVLYTDTEGMWRVQAVTVEGKAFDNRVSLPKEWCGLRNDELVRVSQIPNCIFVHRNGFIGGNERYEGALRMAVIALEQYYSSA